jgi:hypothetical protein
MDGEFKLPRASGQTANHQTQLMQRMRETAGGKIQCSFPRRQLSWAQDEQAAFD